VATSGRADGTGAEYTSEPGFSGYPVWSLADHSCVGNHFGDHGKNKRWVNYWDATDLSILSGFP